MRLFVMLFYIIIVILCISFAVLNAEPVQVNFYVTTIKLPISVLMSLMLALGIIIGFLILAWRHWCLKIAYRKLNNQLKLTEKEIQNLRIIPLKDEH